MVAIALFLSTVVLQGRIPGQVFPPLLTIAKET